MDRTPAADLIDGTVLTWHEAITSRHRWDRKRDTDRIRAAFVTLSLTRESWPQPRHFLDALPRVEQQALGYEIKPLSPAEADRRLAEIRKMLDEPMPDHRPEQKPEREGPPLAEVEAGLREHYATRHDGRAAAAGGDS